MAKIATLIDDFSDGVINTSLWNTIGSVTESGGRANLTPTSSFSFLIADAAYDVVASQIVARIANTTPTGISGSLQSSLVLEDISGNQAAIQKYAGNLNCVKVVGGVQTIVYTTAYNSSVHIYWRMREAAGIFYWDVSQTGASWTNLFNTTVSTNLFPVNNLQVAFLTGWTSGFETSPGTFSIESVNAGLSLSGSGASTSSGSLTLRRVLVLSGNAASASSGSLALSIPPLTGHTLTASGASISAGSLSIIRVGVGQLTASAVSNSFGTLTFSTVKSLTATAQSFAIGSLSLTIYTPPPPEYLTQYFTFEPPVVYDNPPTLPNPRPRYINAHARWKGGQRRGRTVLKNGTTYTLVDTPTVDQINAADIAYQGGHVYTVPQEEANALSAAGFTVTPILLDVTFPILTILAPHPGVNVDRLVRVQLAVTEVVNVTATLTGNGSTYQITVPSTSFSITTVDLSSGSYRLEFTAADLAGNSIQVYVDINIIHDEQALDDCLFPDSDIFPSDLLFPILCNEELPFYPIPSLTRLPSVTLLPGTP